MSDIKIQHRRVGRQGTIALTITAPDGNFFTDKVDIAKESARATLLERVAEKLGPEAAKAIADSVEKLASDVVETNSNDVDDR